MKYILALHGRSKDGDPVEERHSSLISALKTLDNEWGLNPMTVYGTPAFGSASVAVLPLGKMLNKGRKGEVIYKYRRLMSDRSAHDDSLHLAFNPAKINYRQLIYEVMPIYIKGFKSYTASIFDEEFIFADFDDTSGLNYREQIFRFYPVHFFDEILCKRVFNLNLDDLRNKLEKHVEAILELDKGLLIVSTSSVLSFDEAMANDAKLKRSLSL